jgi:hypothetical protein
MIFIKKNIMDKLILEEIQRMNLLSKYDNSKTLSEQALTPNQKAAAAAGFGPVDTKYADQLATQGKLNRGANTATGKPIVANPANQFNVLPKATNPQTNTATGKPIVANPANQFNVLPKGTNQQTNTATGKPIVANPANQFNVLPKGTNQQTNTATGKPMVYRQPTVADKINQTLKSVGQAPSVINKTTVAPQTGTSLKSLRNIPDTSKGQGLGKNKTASVGATSRQQASNKTAPVQLGDINGIKSFQDWLDTNAPGWATGYKGGVIDQGKGGGGYGNFGPRTQKAWQQYKDQYLQATSLQPIQSKGLSELPVAQPQEPQPVTLQPQQQVTYTKRR